MKIKLILANVKNETVFEAEIDQEKIAHVHTIVHNGNNYAYSSLNHRINEIVFRQVYAPVPLQGILS